MKTDYEFGGGWGDAIDWTDPSQFDVTPLSPDARYRCVGWKRCIPKVGQTASAEFMKSRLVFEFVEVEPCGDPRDMFFATVKPIHQEMRA